MMRKGIVGLLIALLLCSGCSEALKQSSVCTYQDKADIELRMLYDNDKIVDRVEITYEQILDEELLEGISTLTIQKSLNSFFASLESDNVSVNLNYTNRTHTIVANIIMNVENFSEEEENNTKIKKDITEEKLVELLIKDRFICGE